MTEEEEKKLASKRAEIKVNLMVLLNLIEAQGGIDKFKVRPAVEFKKKTDGKP